MTNSVQIYHLDVQHLPGEGWRNLLQTTSKERAEAKLKSLTSDKFNAWELREELYGDEKISRCLCDLANLKAGVSMLVNDHKFDQVTAENLVARGLEQMEAHMTLVKTFMDGSVVEYEWDDQDPDKLVATLTSF